MSQHTSRQLAQPTDATAGPSSIACAQHVRRRRGFTLVELLTVVSIILLLTAVVIPIALPSLEGRQKREAARQLNSFIVGARTRARQTGRPVGVWLERYRDPTNENLVLDEMCLNVYYAEVPRPYAGDFLDSRITANYMSSINAHDVTPSRLDRLDAIWDMANTRLRVGDRIRFDSRGPFYTITAWDDLRNPQGMPMSDGIIDALQIVDNSGQPAQVTYSYPVSYQIVTQPTKSAAAPMQLPGDVVIDLNYSGDSGDNFAFYQRDDGYQGNSIFVKNKNDKVIPDTNPVIITFAPNGTVERLYRSTPVQSGGKILPVLEGRVPSGTIHLLLGERERVPASVDQSQNNWLDLSNYWVSIHPQTGMVTTTEMYDSGEVDPNFGVPIGRTFAREGQSMGGR